MQEAKCKSPQRPPKLVLQVSESLAVAAGLSLGLGIVRWAAGRLLRTRGRDREEQAGLNRFFLDNWRVLTGGSGDPGRAELGLFMFP